MNALRFLIQTIALCAALLSAKAQGTNTTTILGQWDFDTNDLTVATIGAPLRIESFNEGQPAYARATIGTNSAAGVMQFPATGPTNRILATFINVANGSGTNLNQYTIIMDLMWPSESDGTFRGLFNANTNNTDDAEIFVDPDNRVGIFNNYALEMLPGTWYRLALVYDLTTNGVTRYLNGTNIAPQALEEGGVDGRFSLNGGILFFADNDFETAPGNVNVIQLRAGAMTEEQVAALGGAGSSGLGSGTGPLPPQGGPVKIDSITLVGDQVEITVSGTSGRSVRIEKTASLTTPAWSLAAGPSTNPTFRVPITDGVAFFRAVVP